MIATKLRTVFSQSDASNSSNLSRLLLTCTLSTWQRSTCTGGAFAAPALLPSNPVSNGYQYHPHNLFDEMARHDVYAINRVLSGYAKNGHIKEAKELFGSMKDRNVVSWTIMIGGLSDAGCLNEAFGVFREILHAGVLPDFVTIVEGLSVCTDPNASVRALQIHNRIVKSGFGRSIVVFNTLIDAYCKCGLVGVANAVFDEMEGKDSVTFNALFSPSRGVGGCTPE